MSEVGLSERLEALQTALRATGRGELAIALSGYPDPDAMASAWALAEIAARFGRSARVLHAYPVSHVENQRMVSELGIPLEPMGVPADLTRYSSYALVDASAPDRRCQALRALPCVCVWDHHEGNLRVPAHVSDCRSTVGATATIAAEYLDAAAVLDPSRLDLRVGGNDVARPALTRLATALMLGIATDTQDYLLAQAADFTAAARLVGLADRSALRSIHRHAYSVAAMDALRRALDSVEQHCGGGVAWIQAVPPARRDTIPQAADLLVSRQDLDTVVVYAQVGGTIDGSVRTLRDDLDVGALIVRALGMRGYSGAREGMGGFRIPLSDTSPPAVEALRLRIARGFLDAFACPEGSRAPTVR